MHHDPDLAKFIRDVLADRAARENRTFIIDVAVTASALIAALAVTVLLS